MRFFRYIDTVLLAWARFVEWRMPRLLDAVFLVVLAVVVLFSLALYCFVPVVN